MRTLVTIIALFISLSVFSQTRYVIYTDSTKGVLRINELNNKLQYVWYSQGDYITKNYGYLKAHPSHTKWALEIIPRYELFFTREERKNAICLTEDWTRQ